VLTRDEVVGWYGAAYRLISIPVFIPVVITAALFPALSAAAVESNERFITLARRSLQIVLITTVPIAFGLALVAGRLIGFLGYPDDFKDAVPLVTILALHVPFVAADMVLGCVLTARDRQRAWALTGVSAAIINPSLNLLLIPYFGNVADNGAIGAAIATLSTEVFMMVVGIWLLPDRLIDRSTLFVLGKCLLASGLMAAAVVALAGVPFPIAVLAGGLVYTGAAVAFGLISTKDLQQLRWYVSRRGSPAPQASASPAA
jgi:O-antigen/teichoic acid export membrane protein